MKLSLNVSQRKEKDDFLIDVPNDFYNAKFVDGEIYYEIRDSRNNKILENGKKFLKRYLIILLGLLIMFGVIVSSSLYIREISFSNYEDESVYQEVMTSMKKVGPFYYPSQKLNTLESKLRINHPEYAWIGLRKDTSILYIDIDKIDVEIVPEVTLKKGDIISSANGLVDKMIVLRGKSNINLGDVVKKGDLLISGTLSENEIVSPLAYIYARTFTYEKVVVDKYYEYSVEKLKSTRLSFKESDNSKVLFDFFFFKIFRYYEIEKKTIGDIRSCDIGRMYAESIVKKNFNNSHDLNKEYIIDMKVISFLEDEESYEFTFLVNKYENIATFVEY